MLAGDLDIPIACQSMPDLAEAQHTLRSTSQSQFKVFCGTAAITITTDVAAFSVGTRKCRLNHALVRHLCT